jgi:protein-L-isoaspartate(D-aspartate) O-methyltransferase
VLDVIRQLPRHLFIDEALASRAYEDTALPIGQGQTISQPWIVARMTEALIEHGVPKKVLEIGTGSGYQAAVLAALVGQLYTVERIEELLRNARRRFRKLGITNIRSKHDDGRLGWPEEAPFDAIILTAAGAELDETLLDQLAPEGCLVAPVGPPGRQSLLRLRGIDGEWVRESLGAVSFVPLLGGVA